MLSPFVNLYIKIRAKKEHKRLPSEYRQILSRVIGKYSDAGCRLVYAWFWDAGDAMPNASATIPGIILINSVWAYLLITGYDNEVVMDAFDMTICHELTHLDNDYLYIEPFTKESRFVYWVNEVHADFGGIVKAFDGDGVRGIKSLQYKYELIGNRDKDSRMHPSWQKRIEYVRSGIFDSHLIRKIADAVGCKDQDLIDKVCGHYASIEFINAGLQ